MKKLNKKGFTLAELLIVVAIIAVLVAIAIPVFNAQLEKAREATDAANLRAKYAELTVKVLDEGTSQSGSVKVTTTSTTWKTSPQPKIADKSYTKKTSGTYSVKVAKDGTLTIS